MHQSELEVELNKMVDNNISLSYDVYDFEDGLQHLRGTPLVPNHDYVMKVMIKNIGYRPSFSRIFIELVANSGLITLYTRRTYHESTDISFSDPGNPSERIRVMTPFIGPLETRDWWVPFRVSNTVQQNKTLVTVYLSARVIPVGYEDAKFEWPDTRHVSQ